MKSILKPVLIVFGWIVVFQANALDNRYSIETFDLYIQGKMPQWIDIIGQMEADPSQTSQLHMQTLQYYYGLVGHLIDKKQNDQASQVLKKANSLLAVVEKKLPDDPVVCGLKSNFIGFSIALSPVKATILFRGMLKSAHKAKRPPRCLIRRSIRTTTNRRGPLRRMRRAWATCAFSRTSPKPLITAFT